MKKNVTEKKCFILSAAFILGLTLMTGCGPADSAKLQANTQKVPEEVSVVSVAAEEKQAPKEESDASFIQLAERTCTVEGCTLENCDGTVHHSEIQRSCTVEGCTLENCDGTVHHSEIQRSCTVEGCTLENCDGSLHHSENQRNVHHNNGGGKHHRGRHH